MLLLLLLLQCMQRDAAIVCAHEHDVGKGVCVAVVVCDCTRQCVPLEHGIQFAGVGVESGEGVLLMVVSVEEGGVCEVGWVCGVLEL